MVHQIAGNLNQGATANVSQRTVSPTLHHIRYGSRCPILKPLLLSLNTNGRFQFANDYKDWTTHDWKRIMWSNESCFILHHVDGIE
ncbi:hypothetical protein TNCV_915841 [Trichonephila clavipes]|nr:hypothetical protein TNCV_915841 [Trichonephila clavipes]